MITLWETKHTKENEDATEQIKYARV